MRHFIPVSAVFVAMTVAACGRQSSMDEQMKKDLEAASAGGIELAPAGARTNVVSAIESKQPVQPRVSPTRRTNDAPAKTPPRVTPQVTNTNTEPIATRPVTRPAVQPPPPGGYKTINEVIRNAPFPIKPATKRP
jgi:hypothetical protein